MMCYDINSHQQGNKYSNNATDNYQVHKKYLRYNCILN